jgi:hypothetical protein
MQRTNERYCQGRVDACSVPNLGTVAHPPACTATVRSAAVCVMLLCTWSNLGLGAAFFHKNVLLLLLNTV